MQNQEQPHKGKKQNGNNILSDIYHPDKKTTFYESGFFMPIILFEDSLVNLRAKNETLRQ